VFRSVLLFTITHFLRWRYARDLTLDLVGGMLASVYLHFNIGGIAPMELFNILQFNWNQVASPEKRRTCLKSLPGSSI